MKHENTKKEKLRKIKAGFNKSNFFKACLLAISLGCAVSASFAEETKTEKAQTIKNKAVDNVKEAYRNAKDETCYLVHGKMECAAKKIANKTRTATDKLGTRVIEAKNKAD